MYHSKKSTIKIPAIPRTYMGFEQIKKQFSEYCTKLDAIYIPTNLKREYFNGKFHANLHKYAHNVYAIFDIHEAEEYPSAAVRCSSLFKCISYDFSIASMYTSDIEKLTLNKNYTFNLPFKRNYAIKHAKNNNYKKIMLLDDDIFLDKKYFAQAINTINCDANICMVGFYVLDYPDISSIDCLSCLAFDRKAEVSVAANCILLNIDMIKGFFPNIYNEDWFFLYVANWKNTCLSSGYAYQHYNNSWNDANRVIFEQFGDIMASGIKINYMNNRHPLNGDKKFWHMILEKRIRELELLSTLNLKKYIKNDLLFEIINKTHSFKAENFLKFSEYYLDATLGGQR